MPKISRITTQKKNKQRYNIFVDDQYAFSVDEDILVQYMLRKGMDIDQETMNDLIRKDGFHKAFTLAINYLSYRMRSEKEIRTYLDDKEIDEEKINYVIDRLKQENYLDDGEFATALVRTRIHTSSKGPMLVKKELFEKGVSPQVAEEAMKHYTFDVQIEKASKWVEKKLRLDGKKSFREQLQKVQQTLMQKGFPKDAITEALENVKDENDEDAEWDAVVYQGEKALRKYSQKAEGNELKHKLKGVLYRKGFSFELIERFIEEYVDEQE